MSDTKQRGGSTKVGKGTVMSFSNYTTVSYLKKEKTALLSFKFLNHTLF
jgi:hypothetical protein